MWHAFGGLGQWTEWHAWGKTMRELLATVADKVNAYGHAFIEDPTGRLTWFAVVYKGKALVRPYKPLQSDWGVEEP